MHAASHVSRAPVSVPPRSRDQHRPAARDDLWSLASAVGNRAFTRSVARCAGGSSAHALHHPGQPCCEECAAEENELAAAVQARKHGNIDNPARPWIDFSATGITGGLGIGDGGVRADVGSGAPVCPPGNSAKKDTVSIQPVVIADDDGKNPTTVPALAKVQEIWKKCCIDISIAATKTINKTAYKTLDESPDDKPTDEEKKMFADGGAFDGVQVYVPVEFTMGGKTGKDVNGGGATYEGGKAHPKVVVVEGALPEVVAHEVGHAVGHLAHDANDTVMKPTGKHDVANKTAVSKGVCTSARTGTVLATGANDCCMNPT